MGGPSQPNPLHSAGLSIAAKPWETEFFGRPFGSLTWHSEASVDLAELTRLCLEADGEGYAVIECHVDSSEFLAIATLERAEFRLVDSRVRFLTKWSRDQIPALDPKRGQVLDARPEDRNRIIELTHEGLTNNDRFVSRFKNREYFSDVETRRYFEAWIENTAYGADAVSAVYVVDDEVVGYYVYEARDTLDGLPVVKGILTAVAPEHRGSNAQLAMQAHLYRKLGYSVWYLDNTTQVTNLPVIRNHIRSGKHLSDIAFTFYRTPPP